MVRADPAKLQQVLANLLSNACKYSPDAADVRVSAVAIDGQVRFSVEDKGLGVPPEALANIFKPFYRVDEARDSSKGGIGLGLAIAQRAIRIHHGTIWAENASPGLRVFIDLPLETSVAASNN